MKLRVAFNDTFAGLIYSAGKNDYVCYTTCCHGLINIESNRVLNTLRTSALFISSNAFDNSLLIIRRSFPKISNLVSLISLANLALYNLIERF